MKNIKYIVIGVIAFATQFSFAQVKDENIGSEVVNIVKPYTPTISDAFKVKETPVIEDEDNTQKETITYNIFSFPVASTFTPAKGRAADVDKAEKVKLYNNYATLGFGNYPTINAELFITENLSRNTYIGGMLRHLSSQGGIKDAVLDDYYYNTDLDITYGSRERDMSWNIDLGAKNKVYNWYGLPIKNIFYDQPTLEGMDATQTYNTVSLGGKLHFKKSAFSGVSMLFKRFSDAFGSGENRFFIKPSFNVDTFGQKIKADVIVDYVGGRIETRTTYVSHNLTFIDELKGWEDSSSVIMVESRRTFKNGMEKDTFQQRFYIFNKNNETYSKGCPREIISGVTFHLSDIYK